MSCPVHSKWHNSRADSLFIMRRCHLVETGKHNVNSDDLAQYTPHALHAHQTLVRVGEVSTSIFISAKQSKRQEEKQNERKEKKKKLYGKQAQSQTRTRPNLCQRRLTLCMWTGWHRPEENPFFIKCLRQLSLWHSNIWTVQFSHMTATAKELQCRFSAMNAMHAKFDFVLCF